HPALWSPISPGSRELRIGAEVLDGVLHPVFERYARLPAQKPLRLGYVRPALFRIVLRQRFPHDHRGGLGYQADMLVELEDRHLLRVPKVHRIALARHHQPGEAIDHVADVTEASSL